MSNNFGFFIAFIYYKLVLLFQKITKRGNRLYPGLTKKALKICPDFLKRIGKPKKIICISGTNGKTSVCGIIKSMLEKDGKTTINNTEWSMPIGIAHTFAKNVNIFNKTKTDYAIIEFDELKSIDIFKYLDPNYIVITNIFRDSLKRNAYPMHIFNTLNEAITNKKNAILVLNSDDPISSFIRENNKNNFYYSIETKENNKKNYNAFDFSICPKCLSKIEYDYRHYLHIGQMHCTNCNFKSKKANFVAKSYDLDVKQINVEENNKLFKYNLLSSSIFNAFNTMAIITLFKSMNYKNEDINKLLSEVTVPKSREDFTKINDYNIYNQMAKGQNVSATTSVFEYMSTIKKDIEIILLLDEAEGKYDAMETITWLYDTDFEFLNSNYIKKIIVGSKIYKDYIPRLEMAGLDMKKVICTSEEDVVNHIDLSQKNIYFLYDSDAKEKVILYRDKLISKIKEGDK